MEAQAPRANGRPRVNGRHASMDATRQWAPRVNGRHASMDASRQWAPRVNGRHASMDALASMDASPVQANPNN